MLGNYINLLKNEFQGYSKASLMKDLMAGITVAAVALPLALAFGVSSGATAASGMITAIVAGVIISALSGAFFQISGPTGAMAAILISVVATYGLNGVFVATLMAGVILLIAGIFKLGILGSILPASVITGFTSGIAIIIALGQINNFFGVTSSSTKPLQQLTSYVTEGFHPNFATTALGLFVVLLMLFFPKKWQTIIPSSLVAIILTTAIVMIFKLDVARVGEIPTTLFADDRLDISHINLEMMSGLISPAISIAVLGMIESLLCGASASKMTGKPINNNQELIAQGIGNIILPFFGGIPATAAIARSSVAIKSGAVTRLTGIFHALFLLLSMFLFAPLMSNIPLSGLAGVLIVTAWRMNDWENIRNLFKRRLASGEIKFLITMLATVTLDLSMAILIGTAFAIIHFIIKSAQLDIAIEPVDPTRMGIKEYAPTDLNWCVVYVTGPLFFMSMDSLNNQLKNIPEDQHIIFSLRGVPHIDVTASQSLLDFYHEQTANGRQIIFSSVNPTVLKQLEKAGFFEDRQNGSYATVDQFLTTLF
ncbi:sodium-independent anion transporter [Vagococcus penaei]|uniref:Sodium-independent anion transporter n=1 Tax=Vagococcus penaei TaxID=633807 RepID=A0A1Q2D545_9ENTE|nr:SulP family inorganic anion transporter [Vagococcus penaei]AQP53494.1 sodium-independent anion transporter [Vagococcus penaei]RSU07439.1 sodium-independent anion transporter [Vagococcus penaei]